MVLVSNIVIERTPETAVATYDALAADRRSQGDIERPFDPLDASERLSFERHLQWLRASLIAAPILVYISFGSAALGYALLITALVIASYAWNAILLRKWPALLLRIQLILRIVDCLLVFIILTNYHVFVGDAYYDSVYLLFVVAAAATHGSRGVVIVSIASGIFVAIGRATLIFLSIIPNIPRQFTDAAFYLLFFCLVGFAVAFLMKKSGEVVSRRERLWRHELALQNIELEKTAQQLAATNHELEAFAYSVSHDLRAPLRSIDGFSRVLLKNYSDLLDERGQDYLRRVRAASQRMAQLIDDLLSLSRVTRTDMRRESVDLSAIARAIAADLQERQPDRPIAWVIEPNLVVTGDTRLLRLALENLLGNAWKFTSRRRHTQIEVGRCRRGGDDPFFVRDNGAGFDMAHAEKLFGAFQRLHGADEFEGTGIGLATVQRIVHRHGGRVWAEGEVDGGATFYFTLPAVREVHHDQEGHPSRRR